MAEPCILVELTPDEMINIINDYEVRLGEYESEGDCDLDCQISDPIYRAFGNPQPCRCTETVKEARRTIQRLRDEFKKQAADDYWAYFRH